MVRQVKKEMPTNSARKEQNVNSEQTGDMDNGKKEESVAERRVLRSQYLKFRNRITDERDEIIRVDSSKFKLMIEEVDNLHQLVQKPREQLADAEAFFGIANTLMTSVKAYSNEGITPASFVSCLLKDFGQQCGSNAGQNQARITVNWSDIGRRVSDAFRNAPGCCTMIGPMNSEVKKRKILVRRSDVKPTNRTRPEELEESLDKEKTDTDKNMATMFSILRKNHKVQLENLILNRNSFSQTVENLFALSFLIKDGRAEVSVGETGCHLVSPRNAPTANAIRSGEVTYFHFIFRYDFNDWKLMLSAVKEGEELMPHRIQGDDSNYVETQGSLPSTPIRKFCRNRGLVKQEHNVVPDFLESEDATATKGQRGKRKIF